MLLVIFTIKNKLWLIFPAITTISAAIHVLVKITKVFTSQQRECDLIFIDFVRLYIKLMFSFKFFICNSFLNNLVFLK